MLQSTLNTTYNYDLHPDIADMVKEIQEKIILHWNYRGLSKLPEAIQPYASRVEEIYLKGNYLEKLPVWISDFSNTTNLYLYGNKIKYLPKSLGQMTKLLVLDVSANQLKELPTTLEALVNLKSLIVNQNHITLLPESFRKLTNLETLSLSGNEISALPEWLGSLPKLKELFADNNVLKEIPNRLTLSTSLSLISICSNKLTHLPVNGFVSNPEILFDFNIYLNYLSLPVIYQLMSKHQRPLNLDSSDDIAYGCFGSKSTDNTSGKQVLLLSETHSNRFQKIFIELPRRLLVVHSYNENVVSSMCEIALRKLYSYRYYHTLKVSLNPPNISLQYKSSGNERGLNLQDFPKSNLQFSLLLNGPTSICTNNSCNQPVFTEAWIIFACAKNNFFIPTAVICCSYRCAADFINFTEFLDNYEIYKTCFI